MLGVDLDGYRRIQKDRLDDQTDDQGLSDRIGYQGKQVSPGLMDDQGASDRKSDAKVGYRANVRRRVA